MDSLLQMLITIVSLLIFPSLLRFFFPSSATSSSTTGKLKLPKSYPLIGTFLAASANKHRRQEWFTELVKSSPTATFAIKHLNGRNQIVTGNPAVVQHILRTNFPNYTKGDVFRAPVSDFLGDGIFAVDGEAWKSQRQIASHEFSTRSLRAFVETVVDEELDSRLIPILENSSSGSVVLDLQDLLQRFAFDNICKIAFGYDPEYLSPSLPKSKFAQAFEDATMLSGKRSASLIPALWRVKKLLKIGSEKRLAEAIAEVRDFAVFLVRNKKDSRSSGGGGDILSRFLISGDDNNNNDSDEKFVTDVVISFILAGRDTTSAALTWFFWLLSKSPRVEAEVLREIRDLDENEKSDNRLDGFDYAKEMIYTHAALCESMRLFPPVPSDSKEVANDDVLPGGIRVKKGERVTYLPYAMGRMEGIWGEDWPEYRPERWLKKTAGKWVFEGRDPYSYPVFQAGPRICLGKEMAFLQMKRVVAGVLRRFRVVPEGPDPVFVSYLTSKMRDGFSVRVQERDDGN